MFACVASECHDVRGSRLVPQPLSMTLCNYARHGPACGSKHCVDSAVRQRLCPELKTLRLSFLLQIPLMCEREMYNDNYTKVAVSQRQRQIETDIDSKESVRD